MGWPECWLWLFLQSRTVAELTEKTQLYVSCVTVVHNWVRSCRLAADKMICPVYCMWFCSNLAPCLHIRLHRFLCKGQHHVSLQLGSKVCHVTSQRIIIPTTHSFGLPKSAMARSCCSCNDRVDCTSPAKAQRSMGTYMFFWKDFTSAVIAYNSLMRDWFPHLDG